MLKKIYRKTKKRREWAIISKSNPKKILGWFGSKKPSYKQFLKSERRVQYFKNFGSRPYKLRIYKRYRTGNKKGGQSYWIDIYKQIVEKAKKKGYKLPNYIPGKGPLQITEIDIPEKFQIDGLSFPVEEGHEKWSKEWAKKFKGQFLVGIDDDAERKNKEKALAHELIHIHMHMTGEKPHTEYKAEVGGADILDIPLDKFREGINFDQDWKKSGIQLKTRGRER